MRLVDTIMFCVFSCVYFVFIFVFFVFFTFFSFFSLPYSLKNILVNTLIRFYGYDE